MEAFKPFETQLSTSGRPVFPKGEIELLQQSGVGFYDGENRSKKYENGVLFLTTHRLVWVDDNKKGACYFVELERLSNDLGRWQGFLYMSHPKIVVKLKEGNGYFKISFRSYGMDAFRGKLSQAIGNEKWREPAEKIENSMVNDKKPAEIVLVASQASMTGCVQIDTSGHLRGLGYNSHAIFSVVTETAGPHDGILEHCYLETDTTFCLTVNDKSTHHPRCVRTTRQTSLTLYLDPGVNVLTLSQLPSTTADPPGISKLILKPLGRREAGQPTSSSSSAPTLGISNVVNRLERQDKVAAEALDKAFSDIDSLMSTAREVTQLIKNLQDKVSAGRAAAAASQAGGGTEADGQAEIEKQQEMLDTWVADLGMTSFVTKETVGMGNYHKELAKQLLDFFQDPLERASGVLSTVDAYCLYNKARGVGLVSPDDFMQSCHKLPTLAGSNISLSKVGAGSVLRLQGGTHDTAILEATKDRRPVSAIKLASVLKISSHLASQILYDAEARGQLCRDALAPEGTVFYRNLFCCPE